MAEEIERLLVRIEGNAEHFEKTLRKMNSELRKSQKATENALQDTHRVVERQAVRMFSPMGDALRREVAGFAGIMAAAFSAKQIIDYADAYTGLQNRLKAVGLEGERLKKVENDLYEIANRNGVSVAATAELYQRASMARENLGASEEDLRRIVSGTAAALKLQGTSTTEASGALLQLGQLLGGSKVQAAEFNSLVDGLPTVLQAVADGSDRWGGSVTKLTKDVKDGKVSVQEWAAAMLKGFGDIEARAGNATTTVSAALTHLNNELGRYIGQTDTNLSATARMAEGIEALANNLDKIIPAVTTLAALVGGRYVVSMGAAAATTAVATVNNIAYQAALVRLQARQTGATAAQIALNAAFAANPIGLVVTALAGLTAGLVLLIAKSNEASAAQKELRSASNNLEEATRAYEDAVTKASLAQGEARKTALEEANALRVLAQEAIKATEAKLALVEAELQYARQRADSYRESQRMLNTPGSRADPGAGGALGAAGIVQGQFDTAALRSEAELKAAEKQLEDQKARLADIDKRLNDRVAPVVEEQQGKGPKGRSGPTPEEIAERQQILALQMEIEAAQARGDKEAERSARAQLDTLQLTKQLTDAQVANAAQVASDHITMLTDAEAAAERLEVQAREKAKREDQAKKRREQERDVLMDALEIEAELARLRGEPVAIEAAERRLFVEQRINELLAQREGLSRKEASAIANQEYDAYGDADREGAMRDEFRRSFRDGIKAALDGDVGGFFESMADRFTDRMLDNLADNLFNILSDAMKGMNGGTGGGFWSSLFGAFSGGFGGGRATGGPVTAGRLYRINKNTPNSEYFMPGANGTVLTSGQVRGLQLGAGGGVGQVVNITVDARDAVLTDTVKSWVAEGMQQAVGRAVNTSARVGRKALPDLQHKQRRLGAT